MRDAEEVAREAYAAAEQTYDALREFGPKMSPGEVRERMIYAMAEVIRARDAEVAEQVRAETRRANTTAVPSRAFVSPWDAEP